MGEPARALELVERARSIQEKTLGDEHAWLALTRQHHRAAPGRAGNLAEASASLQKGLSIEERSFRARRTGVLGSGPRARKRRMEVGKTIEAQALSLRAELVSRTSLPPRREKPLEREALSVAQFLDASLDLALVHACGARPRSRFGAPSVGRCLIRSRVLVLDEMTARHHAALESGSESIEEAKALRASRDRLARLIVSGPDMARAEAYRDALAAAGTEVEGAERALAERSSTFQRGTRAGRRGPRRRARRAPERRRARLLRSLQRGFRRSHTWPPASIPVLSRLGGGLRSSLVRGRAPGHRGRRRCGHPGWAGEASTRRSRWMPNSGTSPPGTRLTSDLGSSEAVSSGTHARSSSFPMASFTSSISTRCRTPPAGTWSMTALCSTT